MRKPVIAVFGCGVLALIAAGGAWAWTASRSTEGTAGLRTAPALHVHAARSLSPAALPAQAERESETEAAPPLGALDEPDAGELAVGVPSAQLPAAPVPALPAPARDAPEDPAATEPGPGLPADTALADETREAPAQPPAHRREVKLTSLRLWSQPGMCAAPGDALSARAVLSASFRYWDGGERGQFHVDPRLPLEAVTPILGYLSDAEHEVAYRLRLSVPRPETFLYFDKQLLTSVACINPDVVAYYDGALHVVAPDADVRASVLHEYTHHALISSGLLGPAWAQEGIAMNIANETWWRQRRWYRAMLDHPFGIDDLDEAIPYRLEPDQAVQFYAQSAALVSCVLQTKQWGLDALFQALVHRSAISGEILVYELPEVEQASFLRRCVERWNK